MKRAVRIRIESRQEENVNVQQARGHLYLNGGVYYLRYAEPEDELGAVMTTVRWDGEQIRIVRRGSVDSEMTFRAGQRTFGTYALPQGRAMLECRTERIDARIGGGFGTIAWSYDLYIDGMHAGQLGLKLVIEEEVADERS